MIRKLFTVPEHRKLLICGVCWVHHQGRHAHIQTWHCRWHVCHQNPGHVLSDLPHLKLAPLIECELGLVRRGEPLSLSRLQPKSTTVMVLNAKLGRYEGLLDASARFISSSLSWATHPMSNERAAHEPLVIGSPTGCCTLAIFCASFAKAGNMQAAWQHCNTHGSQAQVLQGGRPGQHMLPNMPRTRSCDVEDCNLCLRGADGEAKGLANWQRLCICILCRTCMQLNALRISSKDTICLKYVLPNCRNPEQYHHILGTSTRFTADNSNRDPVDELSACCMKYNTGISTWRHTIMSHAR